MRNDLASAARGAAWLEAAADKAMGSVKGEGISYTVENAAAVASRPPVRWRVRGVLPETGIVATYGPPGCGKSFLTLDMLAAIAANRAWFGCRVEQAPVVYVGLEGEAGLSGRVRAYQVRNGELPDSLHFIVGQPFALPSPTDVQALARAVVAAVGEGALPVIALDTLNQAAAGADENSSADMGRMIAAAKTLQTMTRGLVLLVHHSGKDVTRGLRGHSSLHGALDAAIEVSRADEQREWRVAKNKDGADGNSMPFRLEVVEIDTDPEDGEPVSSCVVVPVERSESVVRRALQPAGGNQRIAFDAIKAALKASRTFGVASAPAIRPCIELDAALAVAARRLTCEERRRKERAQAAVTALVANRFLSHVNGWVWLP